MFHDHDHYQCQHTALANAELICADRGARLTDQRKQVLSLIWQSHRPVKAYDLLQQLSAQPEATPNKAIQPPIIYRALDFLLEHGLIHRIDSLNAFTGCRHPGAGHDCFFLICSGCGNADECCGPELKAAITATASTHDFTMDRITLEVSGQCAACRAPQTSPHTSPHTSPL